ncbi:MAG: pilus assembly protein [Pseudomonadota bacterium]|nr:pilus assembly protein [Pseudomonadota bacterium]
MKIRRIIRDERGGAIVETAFALPVLIILIWMIAQLGLAFRAMAGIQHALGEGARLATIFPKPDNAAIKAKITSKVYGISPGTFAVVDPVDGAGFVDLRVNYTQPTSLLLLPGPTISVSRSKRVWVAD